MLKKFRKVIVHQTLECTKNVKNYKALKMLLGFVIKEYKLLPFWYFKIITIHTYLKDVSFEILKKILEHETCTMKLHCSPIKL